ncbi:hypothetical protein MINTMi198_17950 [Mycobacterium intracellulare M.i.198]|uniref:endonuclease domain-containing protein n=1 Tax=Mycobacterium intracellulare TaxID=1767 RepID=UPI0003704D32|nr:endonuclease domain-containing protein [Mycobacterium intracellulare]BCP36425.1 hypothetical protein MINTMi198_17950 [Mycobacterium intracellulare M.i.198]
MAEEVSYAVSIPLGTDLECEVCGSPFVKAATTQKFCPDEECKRERARRRWQRWKDKGGSQERVNEYQRRYRKATHYGRKWEVKNRYGLEWDEYIALLDRFNHSCAICGESDDICVDHCHRTGKVRGILCRKHNAAIGALGDTVDSVLRAYEYLLSSSPQPESQKSSGQKS